MHGLRRVLSNLHDAFARLLECFHCVDADKAARPVDISEHDKATFWPTTTQPIEGGTLLERPSGLLPRLATSF